MHTAKLHYIMDTHSYFYLHYTGAGMASFCPKKCESPTKTPNSTYFLAMAAIAAARWYHTFHFGGGTVSLALFLLRKPGLTAAPLGVCRVACRRAMAMEACRSFSTAALLRCVVLLSSSYNSSFWSFSDGT